MGKTKGKEGTVQLEFSVPPLPKLVPESAPHHKSSTVFLAARFNMSLDQYNNILAMFPENENSQKMLELLSRVAHGTPLEKAKQELGLK